jgi:hypothetical protein
MVSVIVSLCLFSVAVANQDEPDSVTNYKQLQIGKSAVERLSLARDILLAGDDADLLTEALYELLQFSYLLKGEPDALFSVDTVIERTRDESPLNKKALLAKARIERRLGRRNLGDAVFQQALNEHWPDTDREYQISLAETGEFDRLAIYIYDRFLNDEEGQDLMPLANALSRYKTAKPRSSVTGELGPRFEHSDKKPYAQSIAKALCAMMDDKTEEALEILSTTEKILDEDQVEGIEKDVSKEEKNLPLYTSLCLLLDGRNPQDAQNELRRFLANTIDDPTKSVEQVLSVGTHLGKDKKYFARFLDISTVLIEDDRLEHAGLSDELLSRVYDLHQHGLAWNFKTEEAYSLGLQAMKRFYPQTLGGITIARNVAQIMSQQNQKEEAEALYRDILAHTVYDEVIPSVQFFLARLIGPKDDSLFEAIALLQDTVNRLQHPTNWEEKEICKKAQSLLAYYLEAQPYGNLHAHFIGKTKERVANRRKKSGEQ